MKFNDNEKNEITKSLNKIIKIKTKPHIIYGFVFFV